MRTSNEFKRECRRYFYYVSQLAYLEEQINHINHILTKPKEPRLEIIGQPAKNVDSKIVSLINQKMQLDKERNDILETMEVIERLRTLPKPWNDILWKNLVHGETVDILVEEFGISRSHFYRRMRGYIKEILSRNLHV